ncbi:MAG: hypothetical protein U9N55_03090 [candidate division Zixibacteria bacterium]|nr:hypothetical protein [candidate division Zixibacteria bacterium]
MIKLFTYILFLGFLIAPVAGATDGVEFAFDISQIDSLGEEHLLLTDTANVVKDVQASGFLLMFSTDIQLNTVDSSSCVFVVHVITLGHPVHTYSRNFTVEYGLPARIDDIAGKNDTRYSLTLTPVKKVDIDTSWCSYDHHTDGTYKFKPTAHMDIHYIPNSFGDFYWSNVKGLMEHEYRQFKNIFGLNMSGKHKLFLYPCPSPSVIWDMRFGQMIDPTSNSSFVLYSRDVNSADPFVVMQTAFLRQFGYAPPFLSEGVAGYLSFAAFDMKRLFAEGKALPLEKLLDTYQYFQASPTVADRTSTTFVKFLINTYGVDQFQQLYKSSNDLNLAAKISEVYNQPIDSLEQQWRHYIDTITFDIKLFRQFAERAKAMFDYDLMRQYANAMIQLSDNSLDSTIALMVQRDACFLTGDYYCATTAQEALFELRPDDPSSIVALAGYKMMNGLYAEARRDLKRCLETDSTDNLLHWNLGLNYLISGDETTARKILTDIVANQDKLHTQAESKIMLANILRKSDKKADQTKAKKYFQEGISISQRQFQANPTLSTAYLWAGIASLGLDDTENAFNNLKTALFLETRPFYIGMINLWLGKASDVNGDHNAARNYYRDVLAGSSANYHQEEAQKYIDNSYSQ